MRAIRDNLLRNIKQNKSDDYRCGYVDGVLDMYNDWHRSELNSFNNDTGITIKEAPIVPPAA